MATPTKGPSLTESDLRLLSYAWQSAKSTPEVDMDKLADLAGIKASSARVMLNAVKRKLAAGATLEDSPAPKKRAAAPADDEETPKKKRGRKPKKEAVKEEATPEKTMIKEEEKEDSGAEEAAAAANAAEDEEDKI